MRLLKNLSVTVALLCVCLQMRATDSSLVKLKRQAESSSNYTLMIHRIEQELKQSKAPEEELLELKVLLVTHYNNAGQYKKALEFCQAEVLRAKEKKLPLNEATFYLGLGRTYYNLNQPDLVMHYSKECMKLAEEHNYYELLKRSYHNIGVIYFEREKQFDKAETFFLKAIENGAKVTPTRRNNLASNYRLLATLYEYKKKYQKSDSLFRLAENIYRSFNDSLGVAGAYIFHSRLYMSMGNDERAEQLCKQALAICRQIVNREYLQTALSMHEQLMLKRGDYKAAYKDSKEIFYLESSTKSEFLKKEIADAEARFNVAELKNAEEVMRLQAAKERQKYTYLFVILFITGIGLVVVFYQRSMARSEQRLKLETLSAVFEAQEKERARIAQDLHDNMGAYATSILAQIDAVELSPEHVQKEKISVLRTDAENIMSTLRETIWILKTRAITVQQFFDLVKMYAQKHLVANQTIKVNYSEQVHNNKVIGPSVSLQLYRIVQEAIQNITKHAGASAVDFLVESTDTIRLEIKDNGKGFDPHTNTRRSGLDNMTVRASGIQFELTLKSAPGEGTSITLTEKIAG